MITRAISQYQPSTSTLSSETNSSSSPPPNTVTPPPPAITTPVKDTPLSQNSPYLSPPSANHDTPPATGHPKTVPDKITSPPPSLAQKVVQELQETPYIDTHALDQEPESVKWRTAAIVGVTAFFLGAFLSMIAMFWLY